MSYLSTAHRTLARLAVTAAKGRVERSVSVKANKFSGRHAIVRTEIAECEDLSVRLYDHVLTTLTAIALIRVVDEFAVAVGVDARHLALLVGVSRVDHRSLEQL